MDRKRIIIIAITAIILVVGIIVTFNIFNKKNRDNIDDLSEDIFTKYYKNIEMVNIPEQVLLDVYKVKFDLFSEYAGKIATSNKEASTYLILKVKDGKEEQAIETLNNYKKELETRWSNYIPEQENKVKNTVVGQKGDLAYLIVSDKSGDIESEI